MGFAHVQGVVKNNASPGTTMSIVLGSAPVTGHMVCVGAIVFGVASAFTVKDANNNSYTLTTNSPGVLDSRTIVLAYLLNAPANASATINVSWTTSLTADGFADEFSVSGGTAAFDKDAAIANGSAGTNVNTPTITPAGSNELLYSVCRDSGSITSPSAGATQGVWTGGGGGISTNGSDAEYDLSASSATAVNYTQSPSGSTWDCMAMAFSFSPAASTFDDDGFQAVQIPPLDTAVSIYR